MNPEAKKLYYKAGQLERQLLGKLQSLAHSDGAVLLYEDPNNPASYVDENIPPRYIRSIYAVPNKEVYEHMKKTVDEMIATHKNAVMLDTGKYKEPPRRYPKFVDDVLTATLTKKKNYQSIKLKRGTTVNMLSSQSQWTIKGVEHPDKAKAIIDFATELSNAGIECFIEKKSIVAYTDSIFKYAGAKEIQVRAKSGSKYKALIKTTKGEYVRISYGLILTNNPHAVIIDQPPSSTRSDTIHKHAQQIVFPIPTGNKSFWKKS